MRSFRAAIARRVALAVGILLVSVAGISLFLLSRLLENDLDASLLRIAEVEAGAGASSTGADFAFHESVLVTTPDPAIPELARYAQLLTGDGVVLLRSQTASRDLPIPQDALADARTGVIAWATHRGPHGARYRSLLYPLFLLGTDHGDHLLQVSAPYAPIAQTLRAFAWVIGTLAAGGIAVAFFMGWRGADIAIRPTREIAQQAATVEIGSLTSRITAHEDVAEFRQLVAVLNEMLDRLHRAVESQRRFVADASHELRGPLNVLRGEIDVALSRPRSEPEYRTVLHRCREEALRLTRLANDLLTLARMDSGALLPRAEPVDLLEVAATVVERYRPLAQERDVDLRVDGTTVWLRADSALLERAIANLVDNAVTHSDAGGRVEVTVAGGDPVTVVVGDTGPGVAPQHVPFLFDRFFQADPARPRGQGTGLGLAIARAAAQVHGGALTFDGNRPGATFRLALPASGPQPGGVVVPVRTGD